MSDTTDPTNNITPEAVPASDSADNDRRSYVTRAFVKLQNVDETYQQLLGQIVLKITMQVKERYKEEGRDNLKELGPQKIVGLMKSKNRRRWYDQNKVLHKLYQELFLLEEQGHPFLSKAMEIAIEKIQEYQDLCEKSDREEKPEEVVNIIRTLLFEGLESVESVMSEMKRDEKNSQPLQFQTPREEVVK